MPYGIKIAKKQKKACKCQGNRQVESGLPRGGNGAICPRLKDPQQTINKICMDVTDNEYPRKKDFVKIFNGPLYYNQESQVPPNQILSEAPNFFLWVHLDELHS
jgi:hypothetical protein